MDCLKYGIVLILIVVSNLSGQTMATTDRSTSYQEFEQTSEKLRHFMLDPSLSEAKAEEEMAYIHNEWYTKSPEQYARLVLVVCDALGTREHLADIFASAALTIDAGINPDTEFNLCLYLSPTTQDTASHDFIEKRNKRSILLLKAWKKINDAVDSKFNAQKLPSSLDSVIIVTNDEKTKAELDATRARNAEYAAYFGLQTRIRIVLQDQTNRWQEQLIADYLQGPDDQATLVKLFEEYVSDTKVRQAIVTGIQSHRASGVDKGTINRAP